MNRHFNELTFRIIYNNYKANITFKKLENIEKFTHYLKNKNKQKLKGLCFLKYDPCDK